MTTEIDEDDEIFTLTPESAKRPLTPADALPGNTIQVFYPDRAYSSFYVVGDPEDDKKIRKLRYVDEILSIERTAPPEQPTPPTADEVREYWAFSQTLKPFYDPDYAAEVDAARVKFDGWLATIREAALREAAAIARTFDGYTDWKKEFHSGVYGPKIAQAILALVPEAEEEK